MNDPEPQPAPDSTALPTTDPARFAARNTFGSQTGRAKAARQVKNAELSIRPIGTALPKGTPVGESLARAERSALRRARPRGVQRQATALAKLKGGVRALAERLGRSPRTVQRYLSGTITRPRPEVEAALAREMTDTWESHAREELHARVAGGGSGGGGEGGAGGGGFTIHYYGPVMWGGGSGSDRWDVRSFTAAVSGARAGEILALQRAGALEAEIRALASEVAVAAWLDGAPHGECALGDGTFTFEFH
ncbi:hypothetical protein ACN20G_37220 (plasmid) [Streptomyces sp. BI20]|uniref:hypothetical protein n=1 Tax=Streptomyces sp. BI20 TaxID=3403460 RepID=UPI003C794938